EGARLAEERRDQAVTELATLRHELTTARTAVESLERDAALGRDEIGRLAHEARAASEARDESAQLLAVARREFEAAAARLGETESALARLREQRGAEIAALENQVDRAEAEADRLRQLNGQLSAERDRLAADLEGSAAAKARFEEALAGAHAESAAQ